MSGRRRKKHEEEHENHERWLVSYADFITLLFAFFVVMYAISSVNEGKYRVLSNALDQAFNPSTAEGMKPIAVGETAISKVPTDPQARINALDNGGVSAIELGGPGVTMVDGDNNGTAKGQGEESQQDFKAGAAIATEFRTMLQPLIERDDIQVHENENSVEVEMKSNVMFSSGRADVLRGALPVLKEVAHLIKGFSNPVTIEGYTDSQPIANSYYASNWELSAARAASVAHLFQRLKVMPERLAAVGYGENRPVAENSTVEGRQKNRRVVMVIATTKGTRDDRTRSQIRPWEKITLEGPQSMAVRPGANSERTGRDELNSKGRIKEQP